MNLIFHSKVYNYFMFFLIIIFVIFIIKIVFIIYSSPYKKRSHSGIRDHLMVSIEIIETQKTGQQHVYTPTKSKPPKGVLYLTWVGVSTHKKKLIRLPVCRLLLARVDAIKWYKKIQKCSRI